MRPRLRTVVSTGDCSLDSGLSPHHASVHSPLFCTFADTYTEMAPLPTDRMIDDPDPNRYDPDDYHTEGEGHSIDEDQAAHQPDRYEGTETTEGIEEALARL